MSDSDMQTLPAPDHYTTQVTAFLGKVLRGSDNASRRLAATNLVRLGAIALPTVMQALTSRRADVRLVAAWALGQIGTEQVISALIDRLNDRETDVRLVAIEALGVLGRDSAAPALQTQLADTDLTIRWYATNALANLHHDAARLGLLLAVRDKELIVRELAAHELSMYDDEETLKALLNALHDPAPGVRAAAVGSLRWDAQSLPILIQTLADEHDMVRRAAAQALRRTGDASAGPALISALYDEKPIVRQMVAAAIGQIAPPGVAEALAAQLEDPDWQTVRCVCWAIVRCQAIQAIPTLIRLLQQPRWPDWPATVAYTLSQLGQAAVQPLLGVALHAAGKPRIYALLALGELRSPDAVEPLLPHLHDPNSYIRALTAQTLGWHGNLAAVIPLGSLLADTHQAWLVGQRGWEIAKTVGDVTAEALIQIGLSRPQPPSQAWEPQTFTKPLHHAPRPLVPINEPPWYFPIRRDTPKEQGPQRRSRLSPGALSWW